ncbi:hypothetical protein CDD81_186 [Ophiocordyceps australis]|uniref:Uncharacterized protein n=1 Tax=Ophiocordyceps australis TaxID=1399860 RepID=A0A2C5YET6_9HYPO|nr:hypothetical protein CDD81_186 [Ophiocordyceps australis]
MAGLLLSRAAVATLSVLSLATALPTRRDCHGTNVSALVVFGDSYSDNGNVYALSNKTWPADPAYFQGRFSNGPVWAEKLAASKGLVLHDYAYAGATTSNSIIQGSSGAKSEISVPSLDEQVERYLSAPPVQPSHSAIVLWGGVNDALFNSSLAPGPSSQAIGAMAARLQSKGAARVLVLGMVELSLIPYASYIDAAEQAKLRGFVAGYNAALKTMAEKKGVGWVDVNPLLQSFEYYGKGWQGAGLDAFGFYGSCLEGAYMEAPRKECGDADKRVYWDEYHVSRRTHELLAERIGEAL